MTNARSNADHLRRNKIFPFLFQARGEFWLGCPTTTTNTFVWLGVKGYPWTRMHFRRRERCFDLAPAQDDRLLHASSLRSAVKPRKTITSKDTNKVSNARWQTAFQSTVRGLSQGSSSSAVRPTVMSSAIAIDKTQKLRNPPSFVISHRSRQ